jgi:hypothetical protein
MAPQGRKEKMCEAIIDACGFPIFLLKSLAVMDFIRSVNDGPPRRATLFELTAQQ